MILNYLVYWYIRDASASSQNGLHDAIKCYLVDLSMRYGNVPAERVFILRRYFVTLACNVRRMLGEC